MKKLMALSLALLMTLSLVACGSKTEQPSTGSNSSDAEATGFVPSKNVTWICTSSAGGGSDIFSRQIADIMKNEDLVNGQTIVISNETDGSGEVGRNKVATMKAGDADYTLLTFNSGDLMPMVQNTKNRSSNFRILAIMAVDKQLMFSCPASDAKTDYAKAGGDQNDFAAAIEAAKNGTFVVIGGSKGDDITTYQKLLAEVGLTEQQYVESGDLHAVLALSTERYTGNLADAPTLSEIGDYNNVEVPVWRGVAAPASMSDAAVAFWSDALGKVSASSTWHTDYLEKNQLIDEYKDTAAATEYVTAYEADFMAANGIN